MKSKQIIPILLSTFLLVSCVPSQELEDLGVINTRGVDIGENGEYETTLAIFKFEKESDRITKIVTGKGNTIKNALLNANLETNLKLAPGKIELEVYGMEAAKSGIFPFLDTLNRDANLPDTTLISISNTPAKELLSVPESKISMNAGQFLKGLIEENSKKGRFPRITTQDFLSKFYDIGVDPILPLFDIEEGKPRISSIAILKDDKYVGERPAKEIFLFNLMRAPIKDMWFEVAMPMAPFKKYIEKEENIYQNKETLHTAYNILKSKTKTTLVDKENLHFKTNITLEVNLFELSEKILLNKPEVIKLLEKEAEKSLEAKYEEILDQLIEQEADSFGYGVVYRIHQKNGKLGRNEWRELYPNIKVDFNVKMKIIRHGTIN